jgi:hypothetical protein
MHTSYWKMGIATILATGILAAGATAQEGASGDVTIKDKTPAVTAPNDAASPADAKPIKPTIVDRDPFVNQIFGSRVLPPRDGYQRPNPVPLKPADPQSKTKPVARPDADPIATETEVPVEIPAPEVTVSGIVTSPSGSLAIISTNVGTRMISAGEKLGDYRVSSIGADYVSFSYGQTKVFKVPMASEF